MVIESVNINFDKVHIYPILMGHLHMNIPIVSL